MLRYYQVVKEYPRTLVIPEALYRSAYELAVDAAAENVRYLEVRYSPALHLKKGLKMTTVIDSVLEGQVLRNLVWPVNAARGGRRTVIWNITPLRNGEGGPVHGLIAAGAQAASANWVLVGLAIDHSVSAIRDQL